MATFLNGVSDRPNLAGEYRLLYDEHGEPCGAYPADEDVLPCGCEMQCDTAHDDADGWDEICRCAGICECGDDGGTDPSHAAEWDAVDADRSVVAW